MKLLPFENFYIITKLKPEEIRSRLEQEVSPGNGRIFTDIFSSPCSTYFEGYTVNGFFEMKRNISGRNSFLPEIKGVTKAVPGGSRIHVKMNMIILVTVFMCVWLSFALIGGIVFLSQQIAKGQFGLVNLGPFIMFFLGYLLTMGGFKYESLKAKAKLLELFDGELER